MSDPAVTYLRHVLAATGWSVFELARRAKVSHSTLNRPLTIPDWPYQVSRKTIRAVHSASGIDPAGFVDGAPEPENGGDDLVPVYDVEVSAGNGVIPSEAEWPVDHLSFPPGYLRHITSAPVRNLAIVTVRGDSMAPTLHDKDVVMIDITKRSLAYDGLFVLNLDGALHVKRITRGNRSGLIRIMSDNRETYPPYERAMEEVEAVGKVLWYGRKE